jgi:hypothetical protein
VVRVSDIKRTLLWLFAYAPVILLVGALGYRKLHLRWARLNSTSGIVLYSILLTVFAFPLQFSGLMLDGDKRHMQEAICAKSNSNGMFTESKGLTVGEYTYLRTLCPLLPPAPNGADSLRVNYYSDGFLPDFSLHVVCAVKRSNATRYPMTFGTLIAPPTGWRLDTTRSDTIVSWLIFEDGES